MASILTKLELENENKFEIIVATISKIDFGYNNETFSIQLVSKAFK